MVLTEELQYIGRTSAVGCPSGYEYYILVYAGAVPVPEAGGHRVQIVSRLACTVDASFYGFATSGSASAAGKTVYSWNRRQIPGSYWGDSAPLTEGGVRYPRWTELASGEALTEGTLAGAEIFLEADWVMESASTQGWFPNTGQRASGSFAVTLAPVAAQTEVTVSPPMVEADGEQKLFVKIRSAAAGAVHRVDFLMGGILLQRLEGVTTDCAAAFDPAVWLPFIPEAPDTGSLSDEDGPRLRVTTLDHKGNLLGQQVLRFDLAAPRQFGPEVTLESLTPVSLLAPPFDSVFLQKLSRVKAAFTATGQYGARILDSTVTVEGRSYGAEQSYTSDLLTGYGSSKVRITATDSRGYTGFMETEITVHAYMRPILTLAQWGRCDGDGNFSDSGTGLRLQASGSCCGVSMGENLCVLELRWKLQGGSFGQWQQLTGMLSAEAEFDGILEDIAPDPKSSYWLQLRCRDTVGGWTVTEFTLGPEEIYMHRTPRGLGLGKYVEEEQLLDCGWNVWIRGSLRLGQEGVTLEEYIARIIAGG